MVAFAETP
jgi:hypothetical protein